MSEERNTAFVNCMGKNIVASALQQRVGLACLDYCPRLPDDFVVLSRRPRSTKAFFKVHFEFVSIATHISGSLD